VPKLPPLIRKPDQLSSKGRFILRDSYDVQESRKIIHSSCEGRMLALLQQMLCEQIIDEITQINPQDAFVYIVVG